MVEKHEASLSRAGYEGVVRDLSPQFPEQGRTLLISEARTILDIFEMLEEAEHR